VQGVGFRWFVSRQAERLGVRGEVWNRADGAVELIAQHEQPERLSTLEQTLWTGPGSVVSVDSSEVEVTGFSGFRIRSETSDAA
jgi:acylphosphatase